MSTEEFFDTIKDGAEHSLNELAYQLSVPLEKLIEYSHFLQNQGMIQYEEETKKIKLKPEWKKLIPSEKSAT